MHMEKAFGTYSSLCLVSTDCLNLDPYIYLFLWRALIVLVHLFVHLWR